MRHFIVHIKGMHCRSCELLLHEGISQVEGVKQVRVSYKHGKADIYSDAQAPDQLKIKAAIEACGYSIGESEKHHWFSRDAGDYKEVAVAAVILAGLYFIAKALGITGLSVNTDNLTLPLVLVIGLIAGVSTCMALVGGLLLGVSARYAEKNPTASLWQKFRPHLFFNAGRIGGYAFFGGILGMLGGFLQLSSGVQTTMTLVVGLVMVILGLKLIGISPRLKHASFTLPSSIGRALGLTRQKKEYSHVSSTITGALTFFLPCGFTQAMQLYAITTGSFATGALVMATFAIGTAPALLSIGGLTSVIRGGFAKRFYAVVGLAVLVFGLFNINNSFALAGFKPSFFSTGATAGTADIVNGIQTIRMTQKADGYTPNSFTVVKGIPVKWIITSETEYSCAASLVVPSLKISRNLKRGENVIEFTPATAQTISFSCSMGMYRGVITVVGSKEEAAQQPVAAAASAPRSTAGGSCGSGGGCGGCGSGRVASSATTQTKTAELTSAGVQLITSVDSSGSLTPNSLSVVKGKPVEWQITGGPPVGCMVAFVNRSLGIQVRQEYPGPTLIRFTPTQAGDYDVTCPMGMWRATIHVN